MIATKYLAIVIGILMAYAAATQFLEGFQAAQVMPFP
jgi:hypothetical protein